MDKHLSNITGTSSMYSLLSLVYFSKLLFVIRVHSVNVDEQYIPGTPVQWSI